MPRNIKKGQMKLDGPATSGTQIEAIYYRKKIRYSAENNVCGERRLLRKNYQSHGPDNPMEMHVNAYPCELCARELKLYARDHNFEIHIDVSAEKGNYGESWAQWLSLYNPNALSQFKPNDPCKIVISPKTGESVLEQDNKNYSVNLNETFNLREKTKR
ncbi:MAG: hypothetical protein MI808_15795 [Pseudomonadales bacterium]|nr:hypothetical protein [Pseudomonadales bacterium]